MDTFYSHMAFGIFHTHDMYFSVRNMKLSIRSISHGDFF